MKESIVSLLLVLMITSCSTGNRRTIVVKNTTKNGKKAEMVAVKAQDLNIKPGQKFVLMSSDKQEVPYQMVTNADNQPQSLIFEATVPEDSYKTYTIVNGTPSPVTPKVSAQYVPQRKDDFAWENDYCAYRMYGPALVKEYPSNGVDVWVKSTDSIVVAKRYDNDLHHEISYHVDHGQGLDCYKVAHTLGAGGIAPYFNDSLLIGNQYSSYKIIDQGPLQATFCLTYDSVRIGRYYYTETITITSTAGALLNKAEVKFAGGATQDIQLAVGINLHKAKGALNVDTKDGIMTYAEDAFSDAGVPEGRTYVGVYLPVKKTVSMKDEDHSLLLADYTTGTTFTYYFGAGWSRWHFSTDADWTNAVNQFAYNVKNPLMSAVEQ